MREQINKWIPMKTVIPNSYPWVMLKKKGMPEAGLEYLLLCGVAREQEEAPAQQKDSKSALQDNMGVIACVWGGIN